MPKRTSLVVIVAVVVLGIAGTVTAQSTQRFSDVPPEHPDFAAISWAAEVGVTTGYGDGTFQPSQPSQPLSLRHATVFLTRYYDAILGADVSEDFTRSDMMRVLYEMAGGGETPDDSTEEESVTDDSTAAPLTGTTWEGTSTFDSEPARVLCGRGPAEFTWDLSDAEGRWLAVLMWNPDERKVDVQVTGPNGATTSLHGFSYSLAGESSFSFGDDPSSNIDAGETLISVVPYHTLEEDLAGQGDLYDPSPDAVWGLVGFTSSSPGLMWATTKLRQQWALTVNCETS